MTDILTSHATEKIRSKKAPLINRTRKALQVLQVSARDQNVLVASPGMMPKKEKALKPSKESLKISKHNEQGIKEALPRRSKRKNVTTENHVKIESNDEENSKSSKEKISKTSQSKKKVANVKKLKNEEQVLSNQSSLDSFVSTYSKPSENTAANQSSESNVFSEANNDTVLNDEPSMRVINSASDETDMLTSDEPSMRVINSASDETDMLTSDVPPMSYYILLAEQRRKALEVANYENARLKDELEVLEVENGQLKSLLKEAEKVIEIVNASLE